MGQLLEGVHRPVCYECGREITRADMSYLVGIEYYKGIRRLHERCIDGDLDAYHARQFEERRRQKEEKKQQAIERRREAEAKKKDKEHIEMLRPGYKTTEFWLTIAAKVAGTILIAIGLPEIGAILVGVAGGSYAISRGIAKRPAM